MPGFPFVGEPLVTIVLPREDPLDWQAICARHRERLEQGTDPLAAAQAWLAELEDSHTWVWPGHGNLPYVLLVGAPSVVFVYVPPFTAGHAAGVRSGWRLTGVDGRGPSSPSR